MLPCVHLEVTDVKYSIQDCLSGREVGEQSYSNISLSTSFLIFLNYEGSVHNRPAGEARLAILLSAKKGTHGIDNFRYPKS